MYILDTDHLSLLEKKAGAEASRLRFRLAGLRPEERATMIITFEEQMRGWMAWLAKSRSLSQQVETYARLQEMMNRYRLITILSFDTQAAETYQRLKQLRLRIGTMDLKIAAIALSQNATLLSCNLRDFQRIPELQIEDWSV